MQSQSSLLFSGERAVYPFNHKAKAGFALWSEYIEEGRIGARLSRTSRPEWNQSSNMLSGVASSLSPRRHAARIWSYCWMKSFRWRVWLEKNARRKVILAPCSKSCKQRLGRTSSSTLVATTMPPMSSGLLNKCYTRRLSSCLNLFTMPSERMIL